MPWQSPLIASLSLSTLKSVLGQAGMPSRIHYLNFSLEDRIGQKQYTQIAKSQFSSQLPFVPAVFPMDPPTYARWRQRAAALTLEETGLKEQSFIELCEKIVPDFLASAADELVRTGARVAGFSLTFNQTLPSLALAIALKRRNSAIATVFGGHGAAGETGQELLRHCPDMDVVVNGEVDAFLVQVIEPLLLNDSPPALPGVNFRRPDGSIHLSDNHAPQSSLLDLPTPCYDDYMARRWTSRGFDEIWLPFEASRGCWWGERSQCSFCGLNGQYMTFRRRNAVEVVKQLRHFAERHGVVAFSAADNILADDADYLTEFFGALQTLICDYPETKIFYQIKSKLDRAKVRAMYFSGITTVQPGIEAFDRNLLALMRKGASTLHQLQCIKLLQETRISIIYGLLHGILGAKPVDYDNQNRLLSSLGHLQPPSYVSKISFDRYSHYHQTPEAYGGLDLKAPAVLSLVYPDRGFDLQKVAGVFDLPPEAAAGDGDRATEVSIRSLEEIVAGWRKSYRNDLLVYRCTADGHVVITDRRDGNSSGIHLDREQSAVFMACDHVRSIEAIAKSTGLPTGSCKAIVAELKLRGLVATEKTQTLSLPLRRMTKAIVGLTGRSCAGKTTVCEIADGLGAGLVDVGSIILEQLGLDFWSLPPREKLDRIGRQESLFHYIAPWIRQALSKHSIVFVDSIKAEADAAVIARLLPEAELLTLQIEAPDTTRADRFAVRKRPGDEPTLEVKEDRLRSIGLETTLLHSDFKIVNTGSKTELEQSVAVSMQRVRRLIEPEYQPATELNQRPMETQAENHSQ